MLPNKFLNKFFRNLFLKFSLKRYKIPAYDRYTNNFFLTSLLSFPKILPKNFYKLPTNGFL